MRKYYDKISPNCCGIGVHKIFVIVPSQLRMTKVLIYYYRCQFSPLRQSIEKAKETIRFRFLLSYLCHIVWLTHSKYAKAIERTKETYMIADLYKYDLAARSFILPLTTY